MTERELEERAVAYRELIAFKPFQRLVKEMNEQVEDTKEAVINDFTEDRLLDKGIVTGIRIAINTPMEAVEELEQSKENSKPS